MIKEYLSEVSDFLRKKSLYRLLYRIWGLANNFFAFILIFGFWLSIIDFPIIGKIGIWAVFLAWQFIFIYAPLVNWLRTSNLKEKEIEEGLRELNSQYPGLEKLLSAFLFEKKYQIEKEPILLSAAKQKLIDFRLPEFKLPTYSIKPLLLYSLMLFMLLISALLTNGDRILPSVRKVFFFNEEQIDATLMSVKFDQKDIRLLEKDTLYISGSFSNPAGANLQLLIISLSGDNQISKVIPEFKENSFYGNTLLPAGKYRMVGDITAEGVLLETDTANINILKKPFIKYFDIKIVPPLYTGLSSFTLKDNGNLSILPGTRLMVKGQVNKDIDQAHIILDNKRTIQGNIDGNQFRVSFTGKNVQKWHLKLLDDDSLKLETNPPYNISYLEDIPPTIRIDEPAGDVKLFDISFLPLIYTVEDDYGITKVSLHFRVLREGFLPGDMQYTELESETINDLPYRNKYIWQMDQLGVFAGETIEYFMETFDNNYVAGFSRAVTDTYRIYIPSLFENLTASEQQKTDIEEQIENAKKTASEIEKKLAELKRQLRQKEKFDFQLKTEAREQLKNQEELFNEINELSEKIKSKINELEKQSEISTETIEKYKEIQDLLQEMLSPELREKLAKLQELLEKEDAKNFANELDQFDRKKFSDEINRLHELMKKLQTEMTLEDLKNAFQKLAEMQKQVSDSIKNDSWNNATTKEKMIKEDFEGVKSIMQKFLKDAEEENIALPDTMKKAMTDDKQKDTSEKIDDLRQDISKKKNSAEQKSQSLSQEFSKGANLMKDAQNSYQSQNKADIINKLEDALSAAISISKEQEKGREVVQNLTSMSTSQPALSKEQVQLAAQLSLLKKDFINIANETFLFPKTIIDKTNKAELNMLNAAEQLSQKRIVNARNSQNNAQSEMNMLTLQLLRTFNNVQSSQSGSGAENFMEMMQKMAGMQGQLNNEGMSMLQSGGGSPSDMGRMAARQRAIRDALSEAMEKSQGQGGLSGRMDDVVDEMEKIAELLDKGRLDAQILARQEKLFNRMLDSQKSLRQKEFSKKREAEKALPYVIVKPHNTENELNSDKLWEQYFRELLKQQFQDQTLKHIRQFYEKVD